MVWFNFRRVFSPTQTADKVKRLNWKEHCFFPKYSKCLLVEHIDEQTGVLSKNIDSLRWKALGFVTVGQTRDRIYFQNMPEFQLQLHFMTQQERREKGRVIWESQFVFQSVQSIPPHQCYAYIKWSHNIAKRYISCLIRPELCPP